MSDVFRVLFYTIILIKKTWSKSTLHRSSFCGCPRFHQGILRSVAAMNLLCRGKFRSATNGMRWYDITHEDLHTPFVFKAGFEPACGQSSSSIDDPFDSAFAMNMLQIVRVWETAHLLIMFIDPMPITSMDPFHFLSAAPNVTVHIHSCAEGISLWCGTYGLLGRQVDVIFTILGSRICYCLCSETTLLN